MWYTAQHSSNMMTMDELATFPISLYRVIGSFGSSIQTLDEDNGLVNHSERVLPNVLTGNLIQYTMQI